MCRNGRANDPPKRRLRDSDERDVTRDEHLHFLESSDARIVACAAPVCLAKIAAPGGVEQAVGDARYLSHLCHIVDAYDVRPSKNAGRHRASRRSQKLLA